MWDSKVTRDVKVAFAEMMSNIKTNGKIHILNTGTAPGSRDGYTRVRLSITSIAQFSQKELRYLSDDELQEFTDSARKEFANMPMFPVVKFERIEV